MTSWDHHDLVLLPLPDADPPRPVDERAVTDHLASRRVCAAVADAERIGVVGGVVVRLALSDLRVAVLDPDDSTHPGPALSEIVLGLAYRVGAAVHVDEDVIVDSSGRILDDERVLAGVEPSARSRVVTAWRDDDLLMADMLAGELEGGGDAFAVDGWALMAWDDGATMPAVVLPLRLRHHPVVQTSRSGDLRTVRLTPAPDADGLEVTWSPRLSPVVRVVPGSPGDVLLRELQVTAAPDLDEDHDDWPEGIDPALRAPLVAAQRGPGEDFFAEVARLLRLPSLLARRAEALVPSDEVLPGDPPPTRIGGRSARQVAWDHVRSPLPETDAERRLREMPRRTVALHVAASLVVAGLLVGLAVVRDFRFLPEWILWAAAGFATFNAVSTWWFRRSTRVRT